MPRPPLPIGTWGEISNRATKTTKNGKPLKHLAHAKFRDHYGKVRAVTATGTTKTAARAALLIKLQNRAKTNHSGELTTAHKVNHLLDLWDKKFQGLLADGTRSPTSLDTYRRALKNHLRPAIGELHIGEATTQRLDTVLTTIKDHAGAATARTCRAVISGAMKLAVRYGAIIVNPVREVDSIEAKPTNPPRALTAKDVTLLHKLLTADEHAIAADLPDLVTFMLGTGVRIGEALAILWHQIDLDAGTGNHPHDRAATWRRSDPQSTKSRAGERVLSLPTWAPPASVPATPPTPARTPRLPRLDRRIPRSVEHTPLSPHRPVPCRQQRSPRVGPNSPCPPPPDWPQPQASRTDPGLAQTRLELIETGRLKPNHRLVSNLAKTYGIDLGNSPDLLAQLQEAILPTESDKLAWIRSHALRKTTATALDQADHTARQIADQLGQAKVSVTQGTYLHRQPANPAAAQALEHAFDDPDLM
jgi:integrase